MGCQLQPKFLFMFVLFRTAVPLITTFISRRQLLTKQKKKSWAIEAKEIYQETHVYSTESRRNNEVKDSDHFCGK